MAVLEPKKRGGPDELTFVSADRIAGKSQAQRSYSDFAINGRRLHGILHRDFISVFGWLDRARERKYARALLPAGKSESRAALYICPECADHGCGFFSVKVAISGDCIVWSEPGWEDDLHISSTPAPFVAGPGGPWRDLWFDQAQYRAALGFYR